MCDGGINEGCCILDDATFCRDLVAEKYQSVKMKGQYGEDELIRLEFKTRPRHYRACVYEEIKDDD